MDFKKDERYYNINTLNMLFAISSIIFLFAMIWMFVDDFYKKVPIKEQIKHRELATEITNFQIAEVEGNLDKNYLDILKEKIDIATTAYNLKIDNVKLIEEEFSAIEGEFYKANMNFSAQKALLDESKYLIENENSSHKHEHDESDASHEDSYYGRYIEDEKITFKLKSIRDDLETKMIRKEDELATFYSDIKNSEDELNAARKEIDLLLTKLSTLDNDQMDMFNYAADLFRDLPIVNFLNPYYEIKQIVVPDVKYDVNFAKIPTVDRCTSCHMSIDDRNYSKYNLIEMGLYKAERFTDKNNNGVYDDNEEFIDENQDGIYDDYELIQLNGEEITAQPYIAHPDLDLYLSSTSPHNIEAFGCTSCHSGRGRGTDFYSTVHMPNDLEQKKEWEEKYGWEQMHYWLEPMLPTKYIEASCFKCHDSQPILNGGEKLALGLSLIDKSGCNNCHHIETYQSDRHSGPPLNNNIEAKVSKEWMEKWIYNPQSFRYNTWMPHFFMQDNNSDEDMIARNKTEVKAIVEHLYDDSKVNKHQYNEFIGNAENGEVLFNAVGCRGCHIMEENNSSIGDIEVAFNENTNYEMLLNPYGYEVDSDDPTSIEKMDRYNLLKYQGPNLVGLGSKTNAKWLFDWIKDPYNYWEHTKMPNLRLTDEETKDIIAYLLTSKNEDFEKESIDALNMQELDNIAMGWLEKSYSASDAKKQLELFTDNEKIEYVANKSINYYGCYTCHEIDGYEKGKPIGAELTHEGSKDIHKLDFGYIHHIEHLNYAWFEQKLANPRIFDRHKEVSNEDKLRMPNFYFKPEEIEAIVTALVGFSNKEIADRKKTYNLIEDKQVFEGYELINKNNCQGCHEIDGFGGQIAEVIGFPEYSPPNLNTQGIKAQPDWLFNFFKHPEVIRPNLQVKMPSFNFTDDEWTSIIKAFQHMENHNLLIESDYEVDLTTDLAMLKYEAGKFIYEIGDCSKCHFGASQKDSVQGLAEGNPSTWAPNLGLSKDRLRHDWIVEWLKNPNEIMLGTKMPAPYIPETLDEALALRDAEGGDAIADFAEYINNNHNGDYELFKQLLLEGLRDNIYLLNDYENVNDYIKTHFNNNGYDFLRPSKKSTDDTDDLDEDDDNWNDDEQDWDDGDDEDWDEDDGDWD